ncbi:ABC transporter substrate-binding protein [Enterococcus asini]|uniref:ABC transporter substrate-binding protein n=1 Tax=Enterococcus asini TaxID=57732 RepID=UPI000E53736A|nr:sugar ABC transporter substrate-binding protein [Enterococcus asini]RGW12362.1 sugar ABC transporter substrate-binding protein [Enterococcus asini]
MKKVLGLLTAVTLLGTLAACGNNSSGSKDSESKTDKLTVLLSEEPSETNALNIAFKTWAKEKGKELETIVIPYDDQLTKFPLMVKNNDVPDIVATTRLTRLYPEEFIDMKDEIDTSIFDETALKIISQDYSGEEVLAAPNQYTITSYFYNADAFKKAGITPPSTEEPWTLEQMYDAAEKLKESGGVKYGMAVDFSRARYDNFMYSNGGSMTEKSGDSFDVTINSSENVKTLEQFIDMNNNGVMPKVIWTGGSSDNPADYFKNGDVGIYLSGSWNYEQFTNDISSFDFAVMPSPKGTVQQSAITGGSGLAIPKSAEGKDLAIDFLKWLYEEDNYKTYLTNDKGLSFIKDIEVVDEDPEIAKDYEVMQSEMENVTDQFLVDEESEWRNYLDNEYRDRLKQAVSGEMTAQEALDSFAKDLAKKSDWEIKK